MRNSHIVTGLLFILVCVTTGLILAWLHGRPDRASSPSLAQVTHNGTAQVEPMPAAGTDEPDMGGNVTLNEPELSQGYPSDDTTTAGSTSEAVTVEDAQHRRYAVTINEHGAVLRSEAMTIFLGASCDASSNSGLSGEWRWANGGFIVHLGTKDVGFPRQDPPMPEGANIEACAM